MLDCLGRTAEELEEVVATAVVRRLWLQRPQEVHLHGLLLLQQQPVALECKNCN